MDNGIATVLAIVFCILLLRPMVGGLRARLPGGPMKGMAWVIPAFLVVLAAHETGLLETIGIDPQEALYGVLLCGFGLAFADHAFNRLRQW